MKIKETHKNGSQIEISGVFGVHQVIQDWRDRQDKDQEPADEAPKTGFRPNA